MKNPLPHKVNFAPLSILLSLGLCVTPSLTIATSNTLEAGPSMTQSVHPAWDEAPDSEWPTEEQP